MRYAFLKGYTQPAYPHVRNRVTDPILSLQLGGGVPRSLLAV